MKTSGRLTLFGLKRVHSFDRNKALRGRDNFKCLIWSGQWSQYWGPNSRGYTPYKPGAAPPNHTEAGIYTFAEALDSTWHCGREKRITFEFLTAK